MIRVAVTASNADGSSVPAVSDTTDVVTGGPPPLGRASVGAASAGGGSGFIAVSGPYTLGAAASTGSLTGYLRGGSSTQPNRALIYKDSGSNTPGAFVAASTQVTIAANAPAAWVGFPLSSPATLAAGTYWLGYWFGGSGVQVSYDTIAGSGRYVAASYSSSGSPPTVFTGGTVSTLAFSLYAALG